MRGRGLTGAEKRGRGQVEGLEVERANGARSKVGTHSMGVEGKRQEFTQENKSGDKHEE